MGATLIALSVPALKPLFGAYVLTETFLCLYVEGIISHATEFNFMRILGGTGDSWCCLRW